MAAAAISEKIQMAISPQLVVRYIPCLVLGWGFRGRPIWWRYFRFEQIQDGGGRHLGKNLNGHISATGVRSTPWRYLRFEQIQVGGRRYLGKFSNGHISATGRPIHSMFGSRVGFSGSADLMALFPVRTNPRWRTPPSLKNFKWLYLRNRLSDPLYVLLYGLFFGDGGSNGAISANHMYGHFTCLRRQHDVT